MRALKNLLVTGGCGFIGANFIRFLFDKTDFGGRLVNVDKLTYAGNPDNLAGLEGQAGDRYIFECADIGDVAALSRIFTAYDIDTVVHFAAETHVDRSIVGARAFIETNVTGTYTLLEAAKSAWAGRDDVLFHHISTDEVFGSLGPTGAFREDTPYAPRNPYSASKAAADHLAQSYFHTYGLPLTLSNCSNNYGPYQFPEKVIPLMILNMLEGKPLPVYGDGLHVRDWIYVEDHCSGIWAILQKGATGESYNLGGETEMPNIQLVTRLCELVARLQNRAPETYQALITHVKDRPGHDRRYAIDCAKVKRELGWQPEIGFARGLELTVRWYLDHPDWIVRVKTGEYRRWLEQNYAGRSA